jgi:hypothetical protein
MIGIIAKDSEIPAVREFFQLFKTPWEFCVTERRYDVVIVTSGDAPTHPSTDLLVLYSSSNMKLDHGIGATVGSAVKTGWLKWGDNEFPIYGDLSALQGPGRPFLGSRETSATAALEFDGPSPQTVRIGYDLFEEVAFLLSGGQPPSNAHIPTLELHISLLRSIMVSSGISFVEIPPVPAGYDFMACLSHDVDFIGINEHRFDMTMWGFLYRAIVGSFLDIFRGKGSWSKLAQNWKAALSLPFVYLGWLDDFWLEFDRYLEIEKGLNATYFFIPFKDQPGALRTGPAPRKRAAKYELAESKDFQKAQIEADRIREMTGQSEIGVRMHWLYFDEESPKILDQAGFSYDSTFGYNDALGFRAGTAQAFRPLTVNQLLELPLSFQDTAMFYPDRMNLSDSKALDSCKQLLKITATTGGVVTINWHTRSLSPERLWGDFYVELLDEMRRYHVWFGTASEIVGWFRRRRALCFEDVQLSKTGVRSKITGLTPDQGPAFLLRLYRRASRLPLDSTPTAAKSTFADVPWNGESEVGYPEDAPGLSRF